MLVVEYRYDALGRRIAKEITQAGTTTTTRYVYDNEDILLEFDGANVLQARYTHGPGIDEPLIMLRGAQSFFYHADGLGSIWDLTDNAGSVARSYTYDSFGQLLAQTGTMINPYTYTARELDPETGLYYYRARYYDPVIGRFLQEDPIAGFTRLPQSLARYPYVLNNPVNLVDPDGQAAITGTVLIVLASAALFGNIIANQPPEVTEAQGRDIANLIESLRNLFRGKVIPFPPRKDGLEICRLIQEQPTTCFSGSGGQVLQSYNSPGRGYPSEYRPAPRIHIPWVLYDVISRDNFASRSSRLRLLPITPTIS